MTFAGFLPLLVCMIGLVVYVVATSAKAVELGRIAYGCGLLAFLLANAHKLITL